MSSISGKDSSETQQVREHYRKREKELKKQHKNELSRIGTSHSKEIRKMKEYQGGRDLETQKSAQASIDRRDMRHQREIGKIKKMQTEQLKNLQEARLRDENRVKRSHALEMDHQKDINDNRFMNQEMKSKQVLQRQRDQSAHTIEEYRARHFEESQEAKRKINQRHGEEKAFQEKRHRQEKAEILKEKSAYKAHKENEIETIKRKHNYQVDRLRNQQKIALNEKERVHQEVYKDLRDENRYGIEKNKQKYNEALKKERESVIEARESIYGQGGRIARERDKLNSKIRQLEDKNVRDRTRADRQKRRELENRVRADYKVIDTLFDERQKMVEEYNKINHEEITLANQRADDRIKQHYEYYKSKAEEQNDENNAAMAKLRFDIGKDATKSKKETDLRFKNLKEEYVNQNRRQELAHKNAVERMKNHHYNTLDNERFANSNQREKLRETFNNKLAEIELKYKKEISALKDAHNKRVVNLQDRHQKEVIALQKHNKRMEIEKERAAQFKAENKKAQYEYRLGKIEGAHNEEMKVLNAQYRENLRNLIRDRDIDRA